MVYVYEVADNGVYVVRSVVVCVYRSQDATDAWSRYSG